MLFFSISRKKKNCVDTYFKNKLSIARPMNRMCIRTFSLIGGVIDPFTFIGAPTRSESASLADIERAKCTVNKSIICDHLQLITARDSPPSSPSPVIILRNGPSSGDGRENIFATDAERENSAARHTREILS